MQKMHSVCHWNGRATVGADAQCRLNTVNNAVI